MSEPDGFLSRWARRKARARSGIDTPAEEPASAVIVPDATAVRPSAAAAVPPGAVASVPAPAAAPIAESTPLPTMEDVARLTRSSDFACFVQPGIDPGVSNAAMKKLFSDPRYNVMDGLDTYIGDYHTPDPIPLAMLRQMNQSKFLGLFDVEDERAEGTIAAAADGTDRVGPAAAGSEPVSSPAALQSCPQQGLHQDPHQHPHQDTDALADARDKEPDDDPDLRL